MEYAMLGATISGMDPKTILKSLREFEQKNGLRIQLLDAGLIYGKDHLRSAIFHAERAFRDGRNLSDDLGIEILLYASGERQIKTAMEKMGIKNTTTELAIIVYPPPSGRAGTALEPICEKLLGDLHLSRDECVLDGDRSVLERFGIPDAELDAIPESDWVNLILSRIAILDIIK